MKDDFVIMRFHYHIVRLDGNSKKKIPAACPKWLMILTKQSVQCEKDFVCNLTADL